jgi:hypothetical protein
MLTVNQLLTGIFPGDYTQPLFVQHLANPLSGMDSDACD